MCLTDLTAACGGQMWWFITCSGHS